MGAKGLKVTSSSDSEIRRASEALMVVAVLLAGMFFQNAANPPGGVWQEDNFLMDSKGKYVDPQGKHMPYPVDSQNNTVRYPRQAGYSVQARNDPVAYWISCLSNTIGFTACLVVILFLIAGAPSHKLLMLVFYLISSLAFEAVIISYCYSVFAVSPVSIGRFTLPVAVVLPYLIVPLSIILNSQGYWSSVNDRLNRLLSRRPTEGSGNASETETGRILGTHVSSAVV